MTRSSKEIQSRIFLKLKGLRVRMSALLLFRRQPRNSRQIHRFYRVILRFYQDECEYPSQIPPSDSLLTVTSLVRTQEPPAHAPGSVCPPLAPSAFPLCLLSCAILVLALLANAFLFSVNEDVIVRLKWGQTEYKGRLISVDSYMNIQLSNTEEFIDMKSTGSLGQVLIR